MSGIVTWTLVGWCLVMAVLSTWQYRRGRRAQRRLASYWQDQAPAVPPVTVHLVTGEAITVQAEGPQQCWTWWVRVPDPNLVVQVDIPDLPPWTTVVPVPDGWPRL